MVGATEIQKDSLSPQSRRDLTAELRTEPEHLTPRCESRIRKKIDWAVHSVYFTIDLLCLY